MVEVHSGLGLGNFVRAVSGAAYCVQVFSLEASLKGDLAGLVLASFGDESLDCKVVLWPRRYLRVQNLRVSRLLALV